MGAPRRGRLDEAGGKANEGAHHSKSRTVTLIKNGRGAFIALTVKGRERTHYERAGFATITRVVYQTSRIDEYQNYIGTTKGQFLERCGWGMVAW